MTIWERIKALSGGFLFCKIGTYIDEEDIEHFMEKEHEEKVCERFRAYDVSIYTNEAYLKVVCLKKNFPGRFLVFDSAYIEMLYLFKTSEGNIDAVFYRSTNLLTYVEPLGRVLLCPKKLKQYFYEK